MVKGAGVEYIFYLLTINSNNCSIIFRFAGDIQGWLRIGYCRTAIFCSFCINHIEASTTVAKVVLIER